MFSRTVAVDARMLGSAGIGTVLSNLLPRLICSRPGWRFRLLASAEALQSIPWAREGNVERIPFQAPIHSLQEQVHWPYGRAAGSDLLLAPNYNIPLRWRGRLLTIVHDMAHLALPQIYGRVRRGYAWAMFQAVRRKSSALIFDSSFTKAEFSRLIGIPKHQAVIYLGVAESWFAATPPAARSSPYLLFVGNVKPHKNLHRLLQAFTAIRANIPHRLIIVGRRDGFITPDTSLGRFEAELGDRLHFSGELPLDQLQTLVAGADALLYPSLYEGFGLPPLEAMAAGCPAVAARSASIPEICGDAAHYCDPHDSGDMARAIVEVLVDRDLRRRLKSAGQERSAKFRWDATAERYATVMEQVMEGRLA